MVRRSVRHLLVLLLAAGLLASSTSCGTLLYPERQGQRQGRADPAILLLDGALLLVFVVPGLVAYAIDFYTGAIYLPDAHGNVSMIRTAPGELTRPRLEALVKARTGKTLHLDDPHLRSFRLPPHTRPQAVAEMLESVWGALQIPQTG